MTNNDFKFWQDWSNDGMLDWQNAKTIERYRELVNERNNIDTTKFDIFFAFSDKQFSENSKKIRPLKDGEKYVSIGAGGYGTRDGVERYFKALSEYRERIKSECDPQEVYCYEYNNHESFLSWDGDMGAIQVIIDTFGADVAKGIKRFSVECSVEDLC